MLGVGFHRYIHHNLPHNSTGKLCVLWGKRVPCTFDEATLQDKKGEGVWCTSAGGREGSRYNKSVSTLNGILIEITLITLTTLINN